MLMDWALVAPTAKNATRRGRYVMQNTNVEGYQQQAKGSSLATETVTSAPGEWEYTAYRIVRHVGLGNSVKLVV